MERLESISTTVIPGGLVLITGVNGFLASHLALNLLGRGYKVRGTVRSQDKADWIGEAITNRYPNASFETMVVPDMCAPAAFDHATRAVDGIAHVATDLSFESDPNKVITPMLQALGNLLSSAAKEPQIKRFVLTSSSIATWTPQLDKKMHIDSTTWNDSSLEQAWRPAPYEPERSWDVYAALKTSTEREFWRFIRENKPAFVANAVLPDFINGSTGRLVKEFFDDPVNHYRPLKSLIPRHFVDVTDVALLHIACLTCEDVQDERLLAFAGPFNFNSWLSVFRTIDPSKPWPKDDPNQTHACTTVDTRRSAELLGRYSRAGFTPFFDSVRDNCLDSHPQWKGSSFA